MYFMKTVFTPPLVSLLAIVMFYAMAGGLAAAHVDRLSQFRIWQYSEAVGLATVLVLLVFIVGRTLWIMIRIRPARLTKFLVQDFARWFEWQRVCAVVPVALAFTVFISVFTSMKMLIPILHPFAWDQTLMSLDLSIHFGTDPWRLLHAVFGAPFIVTAFNFVYNSWFFVMFGILYWQLFSMSDPRRRMQFFHAFFLTWILIGTILATVFSSAGPCFFEGVTDSAYYAPLINLLADDAKISPLWAPDTQAMLWRGYTKTGIGLGTGISAMPSVHVATAFLFVLLTWPYGLWARTAALSFFAAILSGSVLLGWHYAVDGYASIPLTLLVWCVSGRWIQSIAPNSSP